MFNINRKNPFLHSGIAKFAVRYPKTGSKAFEDMAKKQSQKPQDCAGQQNEGKKVSRQGVG